MSKPKISILCPSFNHEKYVDSFINSVLSQTEQDFELIIIDDGSSDKTVSKIRNYTDTRIKLYTHNYNKGINATWNDLINYANANIVCTIASDDMLYENYVEEVLKLFENNPNIAVAYVSLKHIDKDGNFTGGTGILNPSTSKYEILKNSFIGENQLPSPGMAYKKQAIQEFLPLPCGLLQYSDWDLHNKLLSKYEIAITDKCLVKYRTTLNSTSARSNIVVNRETLETDIMMDYFLNITDLELFKSIFENTYNKYGEPTKETIPYFLSRIALESKKPEKQGWGYKTLINFISQGNNLELLHKMYNLNFKDILTLCPETDFFNPHKIPSLEKKNKKYKKRFIMTLIITGLVLLGGLICLLIK